MNADWGVSEEGAPVDEEQRSRTTARPPPAYSAPARIFHWLTAIVVVIQLSLGLAMTYRGKALDIWDALTDSLYSAHKLLGFLTLWLVAGRLIYRLVHGAPPDEPGLSRLQALAAHLVHWLLYGLLLMLPLLGWLGVSLYPSLTLFGVVDLPALTTPDQELAEAILRIHGDLAIVVAGLAAAHIAAALHHHLIRKDGVLRRMLPQAKPRR